MAAARTRRSTHDPELEHEWVGRTVWGYRKDLRAYTQGVVVRIHIWDGQTEPQVKYPDTKQPLFVSNDKWSFECREPYVASSTAAISWSANHDDSWEAPFPVVVPTWALSSALPPSLAPAAMPESAGSHWKQRPSQQRALNPLTPSALSAKRQRPAVSEAAWPVLPTEAPRPLRTMKASPPVPTTKAAWPVPTTGDTRPVPTTENAQQVLTAGTVRPEPATKKRNRPAGTNGASVPISIDSCTAVRPGASTSTANLDTSGRVDNSRPRVCVLPGCTGQAVEKHPALCGAWICTRHEELVRSVFRRTQHGACSINLAARQRTKGWCDPNNRPNDMAFFGCNGHGCHADFCRPCGICGGSETRVALSSKMLGAEAEQEEGEQKEDVEQEVEEEDRPTPCAQPGCTTWAHASCREWLRRRVCVWWEGDSIWYWGTATSTRRHSSVEVRYDDGLHPS